MGTPLTYIEVDLDAIAHNVQAIKSFVGPAVELIAVVKANAYGHGTLRTSQTALAHGADRLAIGRVDEGVALRQAGITAPILVLSYSMPSEAEAAVAHDLTLAVTELPVAEALSAQARAQGKRLPIHVKVDTGMGRFGLLPDEVLPFVQRLAALPGLVLEGLFTHFSTADAIDKTYAQAQFEAYRRVLDALSAAGFHFPLRHVANSAATLSLPATHLDAVRAGIILYGLMPSGDVEPVVDLRPALSLKSHIARVQCLEPGASIGYGRTYVAEAPMTAALVPVGYGDGYHRLLSNRGAVLVNGQRAPIVGRVCMDQFVIDISTVGPVAVDDEVVLIGRQGGDCISAEEMAGWADTINYEVVTSLLPRMPRRYLTNSAE